MKYRMLYRPAGFATLPKGIQWEFVEVPPGHPNPYRLEISAFPFGLFRTDRPLTADELTTFEIVEVP